MIRDKSNLILGSRLDDVDDRHSIAGAKTYSVLFVGEGRVGMARWFDNGDLIVFVWPTHHDIGWKATRSDNGTLRDFTETLYGPTVNVDRKMTRPSDVAAVKKMMSAFAKQIGAEPW